MKHPYQQQLRHRLACRLAPAWCITMLMAMLPAHAIAEGAVASEHAVKAAIIFKIAKFVSWPQHAFSSRSDPLSVCVQKDDPIAAELAVLSGKRIHGRVLSVEYFDGNDLVFASCQILFLTNTDSEQQLTLLDAIADQPVLTIGDNEQFVRRGGIIGLAIKNDRVQFAINIEASETAGLDISAQLLQLAKVTGNRQGT